MPIYRYYIDETLKEGSRLELEADENHHLYKVTRATIGEKVELVNGQGELATGKVVELDRERSAVRIEAVQRSKRPKPRLILAQAAPKSSKLDLIVEKGTELGIDTFWLFPGDRSEKREPISDHQMERLDRIAIAAMKQSGRLFLPEIEWLPRVSEWQQLPNLSLFGDLRPSTAPLLRLIPESPYIEEIAVVIGPEAGLSDEEIAHLEQLGARGASLNPNILRTETASIAAFSAIVAKLQ